MKRLWLTTIVAVCAGCLEDFRLIRYACAEPNVVCDGFETSPLENNTTWGVSTLGMAMLTPEQLVFESTAEHHRGKKSVQLHVGADDDSNVALRHAFPGGTDIARLRAYVKVDLGNRSRVQIFVANRFAVALQSGLIQLVDTTDTTKPPVPLDGMSRELPPGWNCVEWLFEGLAGAGNPATSSLRLNGETISERAPIAATSTLPTGAGPALHTTTTGPYDVYFDDLILDTRGAEIPLAIGCEP